MDILQNIVRQTKKDVNDRKKAVAITDFTSFSGYDKKRKSLYQALNKNDRVSIIAEIKKASPSKGVIRDPFDPVSIASGYEANGASAISVLTDEPFFQGNLSYMEHVSKNSTIPVLRKDFIVDPYQIEEARAFGADALLLIVKVLDGSLLNELMIATREAGLQALVECYDEEDWERVDFNLCSIVGVNNRNLSTFEVNLHRGIQLLEQAPEGVIRVSESGISEPADLDLLKQHHIHSALIGEQFMRATDPGKELQRFIVQ